MLRLLTLTFSQPGYRLLMLTETAGQRVRTQDVGSPKQARRRGVVGEGRGGSGKGRGYGMED